MKLQAMLCRASQDEQVIVESSDKTWSTGEGTTAVLANLFSILALRTPWTVWKGKKIGLWKMISPGRSVPNMLLEKSGEITPERMKRWRKGENSLDVTGDGRNVQCHKEQHCIGTWNVRSRWSRDIGCGQIGDGKSEHWHFRNQWTKMDWSGRI